MCSKQSRGFKSTCFNMITGINDLKNISKTYHAIGNVILMVKNVTWIRSGITINASVSAKIQKNIMHAKNVIFRI